MSLAIPELPLGILTLLAFFSPYAISAINGVLPFVTKPWHKKVVSVIFSLLLAAVVTVFYYAITREPIGDLWVFALASIVLVSASYTLITKNLGAKAIEAKVSTPARVDGAHNIER